MKKIDTLTSILVIVLAITSCENDIKEVQALNKKSIQVDEGKNISSYMSQASNMRAHLTAASMLNYRTDTPYVEFPKGLHVEFYKDSIVTESICTAKYGKYIQNQQKILLKDSVVVYNVLTGDTLHTQLLWWDQAKAIFYTDQPVDVYIKANDQKLHGANGLTALQSFSKWTLHTTTGTMMVPGDLKP
jgi:LPS export ABC transporter protein LptC